jgi:hypothetical protein
MQQLNINTLDLPWHQLGIKPGDVVTLGSQKRYDVLSVSSEGMHVVCSNRGTSQEHDLSSEWLSKRRIRIVANAAAE